MSEINTDGKTKKKFNFKSLAIVEAAVILLLSGGLVFSLAARNNDDEAVMTGAVADEKPTDIRTHAVIEKEETFYQLNGKKVLMKDGTLGEVFMPVFADVPACTLDIDAIETRNGYSFYKENGDITSIAGVDVSEHQGEIDWNKVKAAGIEFAIIRVGYRTYGGGEIVLDKTFRKNIEGADAAGIKVGAYFFSQAVTEEEAIEEADVLIDAIRPYNITYPVIFDWEMIYGDSARTDTVTVEGLADFSVAFCERVRSAGYHPMIYQNKNTAMMKLDLPRLKDYDFWLAEYGTKPTYYYDYKIWQYASDGYVPGISGNVDMNISFVDYSLNQQS